MKFFNRIWRQSILTKAGLANLDAERELSMDEAKIC
jgi:hypothetical protein